jgi:uncharacterized protein
MPVSVDAIIKEGITEVVATTISKSGIPNAAPMGIVRKGDRYSIRMFSDTATFRNVSDTGYLVANFTGDARLYAISAFRDLSPEDFQFEEGMLPPRLKEAAGWAYFRCQVKDVVHLTPVIAKIARCTVPVYNRGFSAVVEATIVGTRLRFYKGDEGIKKIREYDEIVKKCGSPTDIEAMKKLKEILNVL